uniref:carbohydrate ABC transporter permease n=1 Tax=Faecousia sp. TaxID=2952921 RepID=UPI004027168A
MLYVKKRAILLYMLPALTLLTAFVFLPIVLNFIYALFRWSSFSTQWDFVGLANFARLLSDETVWVAFKNNLWYAVISLVFQVGGSMLIAALLEEKWMRRSQPFFRTVYFLPSMISLTVVGILWQTIYSPVFGIVNPLLEKLGLGMLATDWLGNTRTAVFSVIAVSQWQYFGYTMVLFLVAMQSVPADLYESAIIDGANSFQRFIHITIPNIREIILVNCMITIIGAFQVFDEIYIMTGGGPGRSSEVLGTYLFRTGFRNDEMGYASAIATMVFFVTFVFSVIQMRISGTGRREE